jgi:hypothetical protein
VGIEERLPAISTGSHMVNSIGVPNAPGSRNGYHLLSGCSFIVLLAKALWEMGTVPKQFISLLNYE